MERPIYLPGVSVNIEGKEGYIVDPYLLNIKTYAEKKFKNMSKETIGLVIFEDETIDIFEYRYMEKGNRENVNVKKLKIISDLKNFTVYKINDGKMFSRHKKDEIDKIIIEQRGKIIEEENWTEEKRRKIIGEI